MTAPSKYSSGWYADVFVRHELRFYDGSVWTEHVSDRGTAGIDTVPLTGQPLARAPDRTVGTDAPPVAPATATASAERARVVPELPGPEGDLLAAPLLVVDTQVRGVMGSRGLDCAVRDQRGVGLGTVRVSSEARARRLLRLITSDTEREVSRVEVLDPAGTTVLTLRRPARLMKPRIKVCSADGSIVGTIVPRQVFTRLRCTLEAATGVEGVDLPSVVGTIEGDAATDRNMHVLDHTGEVVARVSHTWEVLARTHHPERDTYILEVMRPLAEPLRTLAIGALLAVDTMLAPASPPSPTQP